VSTGRRSSLTIWPMHHHRSSRAPRNGRSLTTCHSPVAVCRTRNGLTRLDMRTPGSTARPAKSRPTLPRSSGFFKSSARTARARRLKTPLISISCAAAISAGKSIWRRLCPKTAAGRSCPEIVLLTQGSPCEDVTPRPCALGMPGSQPQESRSSWRSSQQSASLRTRSAASDHRGSRLANALFPGVRGEPGAGEPMSIGSLGEPATQLAYLASA
jgi:hypothetical protein